jgi:hypothetical protein
MPRSPARSFTSTVASHPDTEIATSHFRQGRTSPPFPLSARRNRSPESAVLFYATDDERAGEEVEWLIRTVGFEPVKAGVIEHSGRLEVGDQGTLCGPIAQGKCSPGRRPRPSNKLITDTTGGGTKTWRTAPYGGESSERAGSRAHS